jgi:hypothetical protein
MQCCIYYYFLTQRSHWSRLTWREEENKNQGLKYRGWASLKEYLEHELYQDFWLSEQIKRIREEDDEIIEDKQWK